MPAFFMFIEKQPTIYFVGDKNWRNLTIYHLRSSALRLVTTFTSKLVIFLQFLGHFDSHEAYGLGKNPCFELFRINSVSHSNKLENFLIVVETSACQHWVHSWSKFNSKTSDIIANPEKSLLNGHFREVLSLLKKTDTVN